MVWGPCVRLGESQEQCAIPKGEGFRTVAYVHRDAPSYSLTEPIDAEHLTIIPQGRNHRPPVNTFTHDRACRQNREHSLVFSQIRTLQRHFCVLAPSAAMMRDQRPSSHHSRYRLYAVSHFPYASGISRHERSVPTTARMPLRMVRWSWRGRPVCGRCGGSIGRTRYHSASVSLPRANGAGRLTWSVAPLLRVRAWRAAWQRAATAWCARRQRDQPNRHPRCASDSPSASTRRRVSGTVSGIIPDSLSPFYHRGSDRPAPASAAQPGARARAGRA